MVRGRLLGVPTLHLYVTERLANKLGHRRLNGELPMVHTDGSISVADNGRGTRLTLRVAAAIAPAWWTRAGAEGNEVDVATWMGRN